MKIYSTGNGTPLAEVHVASIIIGREDPEPYSPGEGVNFDEATGKLTYTVPQLNMFYQLGPLPSIVNSLTVIVPVVCCETELSVDSISTVPSMGFQFSTGPAYPSAVSVFLELHSNDDPANTTLVPTLTAGDFNLLEPNKTYQVTIMNNCAAIGVFN